MKEAVNLSTCPTTTTLEKQFFCFLEERRPKAEALTAQAHSLQSVEAFENRVLKLFTLHGGAARIGRYLPIMLLASSYTSGHVLGYLAKPRRNGDLRRDSELSVLPNKRPTTMTVVWTGIMLSIACFNVFVSRLSSDSAGTNEVMCIIMLLSTFTIASSVSILWTIEYHRPMSLISPLARYDNAPLRLLYFVHSVLTVYPSGTFYTVASMAFGWEVVAPIYFALHISTSRHKSHYYPDPRAIPIWKSGSSPDKISIFYLCFLLFVTFAGEAISALVLEVLPLTFFIFPLLIYHGQKRHKSIFPSLSKCEILYGRKDLLHISVLLALCAGTFAVIHLTLMFRLFWHIWQDSNEIMAFGSSEGLQLLGLILASSAWCLFTIVDLKRVNICLLPHSFAVLCAGLVVLGPASTLMGLWCLRELALEMARGGPDIESSEKANR